MRIFSRVLEGIGFVMLMLGGAGMDNASLILPVIIVFSGIGVMTAGWRLDEEYTQ